MMHSPSADTPLDRQLQATRLAFTRPAPDLQASAPIAACDDLHLARGLALKAADELLNAGELLPSLVAESGAPTDPLTAARTRHSQRGRHAPGPPQASALTAPSRGHRRREPPRARPGRDRRSRRPRPPHPDRACPAGRAVPDGGDRVDRRRRHLHRGRHHSARAALSRSSQQSPQLVRPRAATHFRPFCELLCRSHVLQAVRPV